MKKEKYLIFGYILLLVYIVICGYLINEKNQEVRQFRKEAEKTFTIDESMGIYEIAYRRGALRITSDTFYLKRFDEEKFKVDSILERRKYDKILNDTIK